MKNPNTYQCYNLLYYTPKLWEQIVLFFCPLQQYDSENAVVWYKKFAHRLYIYGYVRVSGDVGDTYTTGSNMTNTNPSDTQTGYDNAGNN